jgi:hypothetical protein
MKKNIFLFLAFLTVSSFSFSQTMNSTPQQNPPAIKMVKSNLVPRKASGCNYLVLMDNLPWGSDAVRQILTTHGETFSTATSAVFPGLDFSQYDVIIVCGDQVEAFRDVFTANFPKFVTFVQNGGSLEVHAATCGWNSTCGTMQLPGGALATCDSPYWEEYNIVVDLLNPITAGVSNPFYGTKASHGIITGLPAGANIITKAQISGLPTTVQYHFGTGLVTATTCPSEYGWATGQPTGLMLENNLNYSCSHAIAAVPTLSQWGLIILGFVLLGFGTMYIVRMRG